MSKIYVFLELVEPYTLETLITHDNKLPIQTVIVFLKDLTLPLFYLWQHKLVLNCLIPEKILMNKNGILKICELSKITHLYEPSKNFKLNDMKQISYFPPELLLQGGLCTEASDIFSLGCIAYKMLTGVSPYQFISDQVQDQKTYASILLKEKNKIQDYTEKILQNRTDIPEQIIKLVLKAIKINYQERLTPEELLNCQLLNIQDDIIYKQDDKVHKQQLQTINVDSIVIKGLQTLQKQQIQSPNIQHTQQIVNIDKQLLNKEIQQLQQIIQQRQIITNNKLNDKNLLQFLKDTIIRCNISFGSTIKNIELEPQFYQKGKFKFDELIKGNYSQLQKIQYLISYCQEQQLLQSQIEKIFDIILSFDQIQEEISQLLVTISAKQDKQLIKQCKNYNQLVLWFIKQIKILQQLKTQENDHDFAILSLLFFSYQYNQQLDDELGKLFQSLLKSTIDVLQKRDYQQILQSPRESLIYKFNNVTLFCYILSKMFSQKDLQELIKQNNYANQCINILIIYIKLLSEQQNLPYFSQNKLLDKQQKCLKACLYSLFQIVKIDKDYTISDNIEWINNLVFNEQFIEENNIISSLILINIAFIEQIQDINTLQRKQTIQKTIDQYLQTNFQNISNLIGKFTHHSYLLCILSVFFSIIYSIDPFIPLINKNPLNLKNHRLCRYIGRQEHDIIKKTDLLLTNLCLLPQQQNNFGYKSTALFIIVLQIILDIGTQASKHYSIQQSYINLKYYNKCFITFQLIQQLLEQKFSFQNYCITLQQIQNIQQIGCGLTNTIYEISEKSIENYQTQDFVTLLENVIYGFQYLLYNLGENILVQQNLYIQVQSGKQTTTSGLFFASMNLLKCPMFEKINQQSLFYKGINQLRIQLLLLLQQSYQLCSVISTSQSDILQILQKSIVRQTCSSSMFSQLLQYEQYQIYLIHILTIGYSTSGNQYTLEQQQTHLQQILGLIKSKKYNLLKDLYKCLAKIIQNNISFLFSQEILDEVNSSCQNYNVSYLFIEMFTTLIIEIFKKRSNGNQNYLSNQINQQKIDQIKQVFTNLTQILPIILKDTFENQIDKLTSSKISQNLLLFIVSNNEQILQQNKNEAINYSKQALQIICSQQNFDSYIFNLLDSLVIIAQFLKENAQDIQFKNNVQELYQLLPQDQKFKAEQILNGQQQILLFK